MLSLFFLASFILGTIIGSFLNVVAIRYGTKKDLGGRSSCMSCMHQLKWYELVPVVSFVGLGGKCRKCKSRISFQYPLVEVLMGIIFSLNFLILLPLIDFNPIAFSLIFLFLDVVFSILMVIAIYDIRHKMIPDALVFTFAGLSLAWIFVVYGFSGILSVPALINISAGPILAIPFALLWYFSNGKWIGFGDAKLALGMGWFLGLAGGLSAVALGFWIGAVVSILILILSKFNKSKIKITKSTEIPFAPFLLIGLVVIFYFKLDFFYINDLLNYVF